MTIRHLIHTHGDLILVMGTDGRVRAYEVEADGDLTETEPGAALALRELKEPTDD